MKTNYLNARLFDPSIERKMKSIMYCTQEEKTFAGVNFACIYFVYMAHHFIMPRLNPFGLRVDREGWWFEHSVS